MSTASTFNDRAQSRQTPLVVRTSPTGTKTVRMFICERPHA